MTSTFAWLDYSARERRTMLEIVDLFREKGTVDELGVGTIRDAFADHFFPGTSTLHSRARYFFFIPWVYLQLEREGIAASQMNERARWLQARLVEALERGGEREGVIGIDARDRLIRPPAVVYWSGLRRLGIRLFAGSIDQYHASIDGFNAGRKRPMRSEDGELLELGRANWHTGLPAAPDDLWTRTGFVLRRGEAEFLRERVLAAATGSLLAFCVRRPLHLARIERPWDVPGLTDAEPALVGAIEQARRFALLMHGASLAYNLMLAEAASAAGLRGDDLVDRYRQDLAAWADGRMRPELDALREWDRRELWDLVAKIGPQSSIPARRFAEHWIASALADPWKVADQPAVRRLIHDRERTLKGALARLDSRRALERWSGASGLGELSYRWPNARTLVADINAGLKAQDEGG